MNGTIYNKDSTLTADFCGYFPADKPRYTILVSVHRKEIPASGEQEEIKVTVNEVEWPAIKCGADVISKNFQIDASVTKGIIDMSAPINSAYYDNSLGTQYIWPSQIQMNRAYAVATNGLLWDGVTSIGDGIREAGDASYVGDGSEYAGLHEFVLVSYDVNPSTTPKEWGFDNIGGANWYTICVPVDMTVAQVRAAFGEETEVCRFSKVERNADVKVRLEFKDEQCYGKTDLDAIAIKANEAYMIRPSKYVGADKKFVLEDYEVSDKVAPVGTTITVKDEAISAHSASAADKSHKYTFIGNYQRDADGSLLHMPKYSYFLGADRNNPNVHRLFFQTADYGTWQPYTCVILVDNGEGTGEGDYLTFFDETSGAKSFHSVFGEEGFVTGLEEVEVVAGKDNHVIYGLNGTVASRNGSTEGLAKGVYIRNGKKIVVK